MKVSRYPINNPGVFASGTIQSEASNSTLCVDTLNRPKGEPLALYDCHADLVHPEYAQDFILTWHRNIMLNDKFDNCLDTHLTSIWVCHYAFGHQLWKYDLVSRNFYKIFNFTIHFCHRKLIKSLTQHNVFVSPLYYITIR